MGIKALALAWMMFGFSEPSNINDLLVTEELKCLADNVYYESRGEPLAGQMMVAFTTLNRADLTEFPPSICAVVYQPNQFAWVKDKELRKKPKDMPAWYKAAGVAIATYTGAILDFSGGATHYYAYKKIKMPKWASTMTKITRIGGHFFFKEASAG